MKLVDWFDKIYSNIHDQNIYLKRLKFYGFLRMIVRIIGNIVIPVVFKSTQGNAVNRIVPNYINPEIIVSLTTFPPRIGKVWLAIESMLRQSEKPDRIILWLSKVYFPSLNQLPNRLLKLQERGLEIRLVDGDIRAHKKYFYALKEFPKSNIVTVDDDIIYPSFIISKLLEFHHKFPRSIICHRALKIEVSEGEIKRYSSWQLCMTSTEMRYDLFVTTGGGTLIPVNCFHPDILNLSLIAELTLNSDDMWINGMAYLNQTALVKTDYYSHCFPIYYSDENMLSKENVDNGLNDKQINLIRTYYLRTLGRDPYSALMYLNRAETIKPLT